MQYQYKRSLRCYAIRGTKRARGVPAHTRNAYGVGGARCRARGTALLCSYAPPLLSSYAPPTPSLVLSYCAGTELPAIRSCLRTCYATSGPECKGPGTE
eukprot:1921020-Rhodomonas_salina.1